MLLHYLDEEEEAAAAEAEEEEAEEEANINFPSCEYKLSTS